MELWDRIRAWTRKDAQPAAAPPARAPASPAPLVPWRGRVVHRSRDLEQRNGLWVRRDVAAQLIWQADDAERIVAAAEGGDFRPLALFCDALRGDDTVGATMDHLLSMLRLPISWEGDQVLIDALKGRNPTFCPVTGLEVDPGVLGDFWKMVPMSELREVCWDGRVAGLGLGELVPQPGGPPRLRHLDLHNVRLDWSTERLYYHSMGDTYEIRPGDGRWFVFMPYGSLRFWRKAPWRRCFDPYVQKKQARLYRLRKMGDMANALHVVIAKPERTGAERDDLELFASDYWADDAYLVLETDEDAKIVEAQGQGWQAFDSGEDRGDKALARALSGQVVTSSGPAGGNNTGGIWDAIARGIIEEIADRLADTTHNDVFRPYGRRRKRSGAVWIKWDVRSPAQKVADAKALGEVADSIEKADRVLAPRGQRVAVRAYLEDNGLAVPLESTAGAGAPAERQDTASPTLSDSFAAPELAAALAAALPWGGLPIEQEYAPGDVRAGVGPDGPWAVMMTCGYGFIRDTSSDDGEPVDVYLGPDPLAPTAYLVQQLRSDGSPDEPKVLLGWIDEDEALAAYLSHVPLWCLGAVDAAPVGDVLARLDGRAPKSETPPVGSG